MSCHRIKVERRAGFGSTVLIAALAITPAALGDHVGPCPPQTGTVVQEVGEPAPTACLLDDRGGVQAALYPPSQRYPTGRVGILGNGSAAQIELGPADLAPRLAPSFDRLRPDTLARIRARMISTAPPVAPADVATRKPPAPSVPPRTLANERILARYQYDWRGRVRTKIGDEGVRHYIYDGDSERVLEELSESGIVVVSSVWAGERLISIRRGGQTRYPLYDGLGSVTGLTDEQGAVVAAYHLDAWGAFRQPTELTADPNRYAFTGHRWESEIGMYRAGARYFNPDFGRFLTQDSVLGKGEDPISLHRYLYANDNPVRYTDPTGHQSADLANEYRLYQEAKRADEFRSWCGANPEACQTKLAADAARKHDQDIRTAGSLRAMGGGAQMVAGAAALAAPEPTGATKVVGTVAIARGVDNLQAGLRQAFTGEIVETASGTIIRKGFEGAGASPETAEKLRIVAELGLDIGSTALAARAGGAADDALRVGAAGEEAAAVRVMHARDLGTLPKAEAGTDTVVLGPYRVRADLGGGRTGVADTLETLENAATDLGGRTLANVRPDMKLIAPQLDAADRIVFYTRPGLLEHPLTAAEMKLIQSDPKLLAKTVFVYGGLP